jgi:hypothetical protein
MSRKIDLRPEDTAFDVAVKVSLPQGQYKQLRLLAAETRLTVPALIRECVRRQVTVPEIVQRRPLTDEEVAVILARHAEGARVAHVAFELGRPASVVNRALRRRGLTPNHGRGRPRREETAR